MTATDLPSVTNFIVDSSLANCNTTSRRSGNRPQLPHRPCRIGQTRLNRWCRRDRRVKSAKVVPREVQEQSLATAFHV